MKVICDNCGAMYKIPDEKLVKPVNKATCRQCGHRMLIPRPRRGADPDERTLVTSVPPTPPPPPARDLHGPPTTPLHEEERTMPTGARVDQTRWERNDISAMGGPAALSLEPSISPRQDNLAAVTLNPLGGSAPTERVPAHVSSVTATPQSTPQHVRPAPTPVAPAPPPPAPAPRPAPSVTHAEIDDTVDDDEPAPKRSKKSSKKRHDPSGDMGLAMFGSLVALIGIGVLGLTSVVDASGVFYLPVLITSWLATAISVGAVVMVTLLLMTSGRGRKPAKKGVAIALGILAALVLAGWPALGRLAMDGSQSGMVAFGDLAKLMESTKPMEGNLPADPVQPPADPTAGITDGVPAPDNGVPDDGTPEVPIDAGTDAAPTNDGAADVVLADPPSTVVDPQPARVTTPRVTPRRSTPTRRRIERPDPPVVEPPADLTEDEERDLDGFGLDDDTEAPAASNLSATPPLAAIDVLIKSNVKVKKCFYDENRRAGGLPSKVDMRFTIKPNGDATSISLKQTKFGELEGCLIRAVRDIGFPSSREGTTLTFPFVLK